ncbi:hypothetical protein C1I92_13275 [Jiangella anatolica]|uniref:Uncharacterized protein n=1 Tax=Jiangella anatolica TaxID=2670374 RepID=A0A2W2CSR3_9ACTN|nr:hypothetical protein C1I92_13275 [Jiangella anatolica]
MLADLVEGPGCAGHQAAALDQREDRALRLGETPLLDLLDLRPDVISLGLKRRQALAQFDQAILVIHLWQTTPSLGKVTHSEGIFTIRDHAQPAR